ncbi:MAG: ChbG/HpnK family deacetylase [Acidobacteriaceae bacterium]|jgi:predicted glycoside hydrolase/deacetylase ChbG (UPF0249 family)
MPARLILNADDFGLTPGINRAVAELHSAGVLTSATLMANGPAFEDAVAVARTHPTLGVGCHIVLTDGVPISNPSRIPTLLGPDGISFRPSLTHFIRDLLLGRIHPDDVAREARAQIHKLQHVGVPITHLDTHKHTHLFPSIARSLLHVADSANIRAIRNPFEPEWSLALHHGSLLRRFGAKLLTPLRTRFEDHAKINIDNILSTDGTLAISATGQLTPTALTELLRALPPYGTYELCCHPGYNHADLNRVTTRLRAHRDVERTALHTEVPRALAQPNPPQLIHYGNL